MTARLFEQTLETPIGPILIRADRAFITQIHFADKLKPSSLPIDRSLIAPDHLIEAVRQLKCYFENSTHRFELPLAPAQTEFQQAVRESLTNVGSGETTTYQALARRLGRPLASRAVGMALGKNPILIVIPCHRVIGSSGSLTGFAGGVDRKKWLLEHERQAPLFAKPGV